MPFEATMITTTMAPTTKPVTKPQTTKPTTKPPPTTQPTTQVTTTGSKGQQLVSYSVTLGIILHSSGDMPYNNRNSTVAGINRLVKELQSNAPGRVENYVGATFDSKGASLLVDTRSPDKFLKEINKWSPKPGGPCPEKSLSAIKIALAKATKRCIMYVFTDGDPNDSRQLQSVINIIRERECQVNFARCGSCGYGSKEYYRIAEASSGQVIELNTGKPPRPQFAAVFDYMITYLRVTQPRVLLESRDIVEDAKAVNGSGKMEEDNFLIPIDPNLDEGLISITGCDLSMDVRDDLGKHHSISSGMYNKTGSIVSVTQLDKFSVVELINPGSATWLLTLRWNDGCPMSLRVSGMGTPGYVHRYLYNLNNPKSEQLLPLYGVPSYTVLMMTDPKVIEYELLLVEYMTLEGKHRASSPVVVKTGKELSQFDLLPPKGLFYVKVSGIEKKTGLLYQRLSAIPVEASLVDIRKLIFSPNCSSAPGGSKKSYYCGKNDNICIPYVQYRDCIAQCPGGADEACEKGYKKCRCVCMPESNYATMCVPSHLTKFCRSGKNVFKCKNGGCIQMNWVSDGFDDCGDNSDEDPANIDECKLKIATCNKNAYCTNIPHGAYYCTCNPGYEGDGFKCMVVKKNKAATTTAPGPTNMTVNVTMQYPTTKRPQTIRPTTAVVQITTQAPVTATTVDPIIRGFGGKYCKGQFDCYGNGTYCIDLDEYRDCVVDCPNGLDEECFSTRVMCDGCSKCVRPHEVAKNCIDRRLNLLCKGKPGVFPCKDGNGCVIFQFAMDGIKDCIDGSDEDPKYFDECWLGRSKCDKVNGVCTDSVDKPPGRNGTHTCTCKLGYFSTDAGKTCKPAFAKKG